MRHWRRIEIVCVEVDERFVREARGRLRDSRFSVVQGAAANVAELLTGQVSKKKRFRRKKKRANDYG